MHGVLAARLRPCVRHGSNVRAYARLVLVQAQAADDRWEAPWVASAFRTLWNVDAVSRRGIPWFLANDRFFYIYVIAKLHDFRCFRTLLFVDRLRTAFVEQT